jgi:hypothetical protein
MVKIKGLPLLTSKNFILEKYGNGALEKILNALSEQDRKVFSGVILSSEFYPLDAYVHWLELEVKLLYNGDESVLVRQNLEATEKVFKGIYRVFLYLGSPERVLERLGGINSQIFQGLTVKATKIEKGKVLLTYTGFEKQHKIFEILVRGFWVTVVKLMGAKDYKFQPNISISDGKDHCEYFLTWTK